MERMGPFKTIPLPDASAFEERAMSKKQRRLTDTPTLDYVSNPRPKCPSTPWRVSPYRRTPEKPQCLTELKRPRCSSSNFEISTSLGEGSFGIVYKARNLLDSRMYAIKKSKKPIWNTTQRSQYITEVIASQSLGQHKHLTQIHEAWEEGGHILIQMELCERSLKDVLQDAGLTEDQIWDYLAQIIQGLHHVHRHMLVHLDLKPENMLLTEDGTLKIADLGSALRVGGASSLSSLPNVISPVEGDKVYMAPELLNDQYSFASDIFSVGITVFEMATGLNLPGSGQDWRSLRSGDHTFLDAHLSNPSQSLSPSLCSLIKAMMNPDPTLRPTTQTILEVPRVAMHVGVGAQTANKKYKITRKLFQC